MLEFGIFDGVEASATNAALDLRLAERAPVRDFSAHAAGPRRRAECSTITQARPRRAAGDERPRPQARRSAAPGRDTGSHVPFHGIEERDLGHLSDRFRRLFCLRAERIARIREFRPCRARTSQAERYPHWPLPAAPDLHGVRPLPRRRRGWRYSRVSGSATYWLVAMEKDSR
jgi:hypothetical protein